MKTLTLFSGECNSYCDFLNSARRCFQYAGRRYFSIDHYLLVQKACYFNNLELARRMLGATSAEELDLLAAMLYGKRQELWGMVLPHVAYCGIRAKFQQHADLFTLLRKSAGRMLVYDNEDDPFWGTGKKVEESLPGQYGGNLLGKLLMKARVELKEWETRGVLGYEDVADHPEFTKSRVMRYEFDQLLDNLYTREAVLPYVMVMVFPGWAEEAGKDPFIPLTTTNLSKRTRNLENTSPSQLSFLARKPEAGYREMTQELYDLSRLGLVS